MCVRPAWTCSAAAGWYRDGVISTIPHVCRGERQYMHLTRHINPVTATIIVAARHHSPSPSARRLLHSFLLSATPTYIHTPLLLLPREKHSSSLRSAPRPIPPPVAHEPHWYDVRSHLKPPANLPFHHAKPYHHHQATCCHCCIARLHATTAARKKSHCSPPLHTRPDSARLACEHPPTLATVRTCLPQIPPHGVHVPKAYPPCIDSRTNPDLHCRP